MDKLLNDETQKKKPKNLDITDSEESSPSKKKNLPYRKGNKFQMDGEESSPSDSEESSPSIPESTRNYSEITQRVRLDRIEIEFKKLWNLYPKKIGKKDAFGSYVNWRGENSENTYEKASKHLSDYLKYINLNNISPRYIFNGNNWFGGHIDDEVDLSKPKKFSDKKHVCELPDWDEVARKQNQKKTENRMSSEEYDRDRIFKEFSATENKDQQSDTVSSKTDASQGNNSFEMSDDVRQVYHDLGLDEFLD